MLHQGARGTGGDVDDALQKEINSLLDKFITYVDNYAIAQNLRLATVRSRLPCNIIILVDDKNILLIAQPLHGLPSSSYHTQPGKVFSIDDLHSAAKFDFGLDDYFIVIFPKEILTMSDQEKKDTLEQIAQQHVSEEIKRVDYMLNIVKVSPIFGAANYKLEEKMVFVLMPFDKKRDSIYQNVIKPIIESAPLSLVCKRADELKTNKAVVQDIWKSICEARIIIADLSELNPNVMYELGVTHTVGKDTILLYEKSDQVKFPFDLAHIRRIEYEDGNGEIKKLEADLRATIQTILSGVVQIIP